MSAFTDDYYYRREIVTDELDEACDAIAEGLGIDRAAIGTKGNEAHDSGAHRSQEWILNSPFCDDRSYTVQSGLTADQARHIAGIDITPGVWGTADNRRKVAAITARLIAAMKAGQLDELIEVFGAAPSLTSVTGYNNRENRAASSDKSHLDHVHGTIDRRHLRNRAFLARLAAIVIGDDMITKEDLHVLLTTAVFPYGSPNQSLGTTWLATHQAVTALRAEAVADKARDEAALTAINGLAAAIAAGGGSVDSAGIIAAVNATGDKVLAKIEAEVSALRTENADLQARLAEALAPAGS